MLTVGKDDDDEELKWWPKKLKKAVKRIPSIFIYIKSYMDYGCEY